MWSSENAAEDLKRGTFSGQRVRCGFVFKFEANGQANKSLLQDTTL
jgi:hypothetical protein